MRDYSFDKILYSITGKCFPLAGMYVIFQTKDGIYHYGKYDFNKTNARRFIDANTMEEFTSDLIEKWKEIR